MFEHLRTRDAALLVDMSDENHRRAIRFCFVDEYASALPYLRHTARDGVAFAVIHRLNRIHDDDIRREFFRMGKDFFRVRFRQKIDAPALDAEPFGAQGNLRGRFLS